VESRITPEKPKAPAPVAAPAVAPPHGSAWANPSRTAAIAGKANAPPGFGSPAAGPAPAPRSSFSGESRRLTALWITGADRTLVAASWR
jgi:hypothetical protein